MIKEDSAKKKLKKMVNEAETFKDEDDKQKDRIASKNTLESFIFNLKSSLEQPEVKAKLSEEELLGAKAHLETALTWLDSNQLAEKEEFTEKQRELEELSRPLMAKIYQQSGANAQQNCGDEHRKGTSQSGPTIEEVD